MHDSDNNSSQQSQLQRSIGFGLLVFYGMGTMVGAGFYALSGKVAGIAGLYAPIAFLLAGLLALFSALAFAELSSRLPFAGGSARYVEKAFGRRWLSALVGWLIIATGLISSATLMVATVDFLSDFWELPTKLATLGVTLLVGAIAAWGVKQAVGTVVLISLIQIGTLIYIIVASLSMPETPSYEWGQFIPAMETSVWLSILTASVLAFYAFIGFEDMVNMAEEVHDVRRTMPKALIASLLLTALLYVAVSTALVLAIPPDTLADANTPLAEPVRHHGEWAVGLISVVSILSVINSALVQVVMAARVAYGMANRGYAPTILGRVSSVTKTPWVGTLLSTAVVALLAVSFQLTELANATSVVLLSVFAFVNFSLWWLKGNPDESEPQGHFILPRWVPLVGAFVSIGTLIFKAAQSFS
ncbi:APC family permease [Idiomarina seosinensis]|uniref:APC family permease n=1 Tax=Idiomarina seosinensis TaxID=281739 RepID=UPI00384FA995